MQLQFDNLWYDRYGFEGGVDDSTVKELQKEIKAAFVEMVGFDKIKSLQAEYARLVTVGGLLERGQKSALTIS